MHRLEGFDLLYHRCSVMFGCGDDQPPRWFLATVRDYVADATNRDFGKHHLHFDDGDKRWLDLAREEQDGQLRWKCGAWPSAQNSKGRRARKRVASRSAKHGKAPAEANSLRDDLTFEDTALLYDLATNESTGRPVSRPVGRPAAAPPGRPSITSSKSTKSASVAGSNAASLRKLGMLLLNLNRPGDALQALRYAASHGDEAAAQALVPLAHAAHADTAQADVEEDANRVDGRPHWLDQECPHQQAKRRREVDQPLEEPAAAPPPVAETPVVGPGETSEGGAGGKEEAGQGGGQQRKLRLVSHLSRNPFERPAAVDDASPGGDGDGGAAAGPQVQEAEQVEAEQRTAAAPAPAKRAPRKQRDESEVAARRMQAALDSLERSRRPSTAPSRFAAGAAPPAQKARLLHEAAAILHAGPGSTDPHSVEFMSQVRDIAGLGSAKKLRKAKIA